MTDIFHPNAPEGIAIIGMSGRFPGAGSVDEFWQNLCSGIESISFFSDEELKESGIESAVLNDPNYVKASPVLDDPEFFDARFFGYSPREAQIMDPQHRLFLECAWEALEHAGYDADNYDGSIGVYGGSSINTYFLFSGIHIHYQTDPLPLLIGNDKDFLTTRVSYKLNLKGPSITVQTACSTSLVAVHMACQSLLNEECDMALAGGVTIRVPHKAGYFYQEGNIASPDGHCRAFDAKAEGTAFGSGVGIVVVKRLADAISDGDSIHAVIKGSAINNDGSSKVDFTAPSVNGQSEAIVEALANAGVEPDTVSYIETHGTGTHLGDPIEITALTNAFRAYTDKKGFCAVGSVKTNVGHLDAAAGVAGLIKTTLALKHRMIPPSLHFERANPEIDFENSPFYVNTTLSQWKSHHYPRRAGINSLGVGGTNAHLILEETPELEASDKSRPWQLLSLSAKTPAVLNRMIKNLTEHFKRHSHLNLADAAYTLQNGRKAFTHRQAVVCHNLQDAITALESLDSKRVLSSSQQPATCDVAFVFSGQGSQYVNMGRDLYRTESLFKEAIDHCAEILKPLLSLDLRDVLYPDEEHTEQSTQMLRQTSIAQPALFTIDYALSKLWMSWGIKPAALVGHSIGEYAAACLAGVFSLEDALSLVAVRGRLMQGLPAGSMLAVFLSENEIQPFLGESLCLAIINGPSICVVSGEKDAIEDLESELAQKKVYYRHLPASHAFHSKMMEPIMDTFTEQVKRCVLRPPQIPFLSNATGSWITPDEATDPAYWARHLRHTVRFSDCVQKLFQETHRVFLEVGPGNTFSTLIKHNPYKRENHIVLSSTRPFKEQKSDSAFILNTFGQLWTAGIQVNWPGFYKDEHRHRVPMPTYPFDRQYHWINAEKQKQPVASALRSTCEEIDNAPTPQRSCSEQKLDFPHDEVSKNKTEQIIAEIWQELLGVKKVSAHDNFFELGGSSLIAVSLFAKIDKRLGKKLPLSTLLSAPTIEQLSSLLIQEEFSPSWSSLVEIHSGNSRPPFFCMHAEGGNVLEYYDLARHLVPYKPFYALQAQGLNGNEVATSAVEDMAAHYIKEIRTLQPKGPYYIGGFCLGGLLAFEMAQQLKAEGEEVALLALINAYTPDHLKNLLPNVTAIHHLIYRIVERIELELNNLSTLGPRAKLLYIQKRMQQVVTLLQIRIEGLIERVFPKFQENTKWHSLAFTLQKITEDHNRSYFKYTPRPYRGSLILFRTSKQPRSLYLDPTLGWGKLVEGSVKVYEVFGYHKNIMKEPNVRRLANKLNDCIEEASKEDFSAQR